ncbi:MAG: OmpA family protein [Pseudomonadota bacterium]
MWKLASILAVAFAINPSDALALNSAECAEIERKYGVVAPNCKSTDSSAAPNIPKKTKAESNKKKVDTAITPVQQQDNVFFTAGGVALDAQALAQLRTLAQVLNTATLKETCLQLIGHSDASGSEAINLETGMKRAQAVSQEISSMIDFDRVESVISQGEWQLLKNVPETSPYQRRVEIRVRSCGPQNG